MASLQGATLKKYRLAEDIGQGGMATVYRAMDVEDLQMVAVKILSPTISSDKTFVRRFRREASLLAHLKHPNIVPVIDYDEYRGLVYLVMPFVPGRTLKSYLKEGDASQEEMAGWVRQLAEALDFAHGQRIIHRDVKPSNILIDDNGNARLTDFGLARLVESTNTLTGSSIMGTPAYISPEQAKGEKLDSRSDQYSLGVILYEYHTGRLPFAADTPMGIAMKHVRDPVRPPSHVNPAVPRGTERVILTCLNKDREKRFMTMGAMNKAYQAALKGDPLEALMPTQTAIGQSITRWRSGWRDRLREQGLFGIAVALFALLTVGAIVLTSAGVGGFTGLGAGPDETAPPAPTAAAVALPTRPPPTEAVSAPVQVTSEACPGLGIIGFAVEGDDATWQLDNGTASALRLANLRDFRGPGGDQMLERILLGGEVIFEGSVAEGSPAWVEDASRVLGPGETKPLTFSFNWEAAPTGYSFSLDFDNGCSVTGEW